MTLIFDNGISKVKNALGKLTADERIVLCLALSVFVSIYAALAMVAFTVARLIIKKRLVPIINQTPAAWWAVAFCALAVLVSLSARNFTGALLSLGMAGIIIVAIFVRSVMSHELFEHVLAACCAGSIISFAVAAAQQLIMAAIPEYRSSSGFVNANYYAGAIEFVALFCAHKIINGTNRRVKAIYAVILLANILGLIYTDCRTAIVVVFAGVALLLLFSRRYKALVMLLSAGVAAALISVYIAPNLFPRKVSMSEDLMTRLAIWKTAIRGILESPLFGRGAFAYQLVADKFGGPAVKHSHNLFLDPLLNFGLIGTAMLLVYIMENVRPVLAMRSNDNDKGLSSLAISVFTSVLLHGFMDLTVFGVQTGLLLAIFASIAGIPENRPAIYRYTSQTARPRPAYGARLPEARSSFPRRSA